MTTNLAIVAERGRRSMAHRVAHRFTAALWRLYWRPHFKHLGKKTTLTPPLYVVGGSRIAIGSKTQFFRNVRLEAVGASPEVQLTIGDGVTLQAGCHIGAALGVEIHYGSVLASGVYVTDHDHDYRDPQRGYFGTGELLAAPVRIGPKAWIGERAIILKGVTVGEGAIIGAASVVNHDVPPYSIAVGVPAKVIRRFDFDLGVWIAV